MDDLPPLDPLAGEDELGELDEPVRERRPLVRRRRRRRGLRVLAGLLLLAVAFAAGLAVGRALQEAPRPGGTVTQIRTLEPELLGPVRIVTVTVQGG